MKRGILLLILALLLLTPFIIAQDSIPSTVNTEGLGEINPETGLPKTFDKFKETGDKLSEEERREKYLKQEWTKLQAKNKVLVPVFFYTDKVISFFNPLWRTIFGVEFSWSWFFIFSFIFWVFIIILVYFPLRLFNINQIISITISTLISSILGFLKVISAIVNLLTNIVPNVWIALLTLIILATLLILYKKLFKSLKKKQEKTEEKLNKEILKQDTKIVHSLSKGITKGLK